MQVFRLPLLLNHLPEDGVAQMTITAYGGAYDALLGRKRTTFRGNSHSRHIAFLNRLDRRIKKVLKKKGEEPKPLAF